MRRRYAVATTPIIAAHLRGGADPPYAPRESTGEPTNYEYQAWSTDGAALWAEPAAGLSRGKTGTSQRRTRKPHRDNRSRAKPATFAVRVFDRGSHRATSRQNRGSHRATNRQDLKGRVGGCYSGFSIWICDVVETGAKPRRNRVGTGTKPRRNRVVSVRSLARLNQERR